MVSLYPGRVTNTAVGMNADFLQLGARFKKDEQLEDIDYVSSNAPQLPMTLRVRPLDSNLLAAMEDDLSHGLTLLPF